MAKLQNLTFQKPIKFAKRRIIQNLTPQKNLKLRKRKNTQNLTTQPPRKVTKFEINHRPHRSRVVTMVIIFNMKAKEIKY